MSMSFPQLRAVWERRRDLLIKAGCPKLCAWALAQQGITTKSEAIYFALVADFERIKGFGPKRVQALLIWVDVVRVNSTECL